MDEPMKLLAARVGKDKARDLVAQVEALTPSGTLEEAERSLAALERALNDPPLNPRWAKTGP